MDIDLYAEIQAHTLAEVLALAGAALDAPVNEGEVVSLFSSAPTDAVETLRVRHVDQVAA